MHTLSVTLLAAGLGVGLARATDITLYNVVEGTPSAITTTTTTTVTSPPGPTNPTQGVSYLPISLVGVNSQGQTTYVQNVVKHFAVKTFYESDYHPLTGTQTANPPVYTYTLNFEDPITSQRVWVEDAAGYHLTAIVPLPHATNIDDVACTFDSAGRFGRCVHSYSRSLPLIGEEVGVRTFTGRLAAWTTFAEGALQTGSPGEAGSAASRAEALGFWKWVAPFVIAASTMWML